ncbi:MAG: twin-arginine translocase subunit TatC, partial [Paludibacteraceae bacterium]|nr:twin-arginine translocase subunit TatC [Paludibacteraceae bacterium]
YKKHALLIIMIVAAIITPPDLMTLILVTLPLYLLFLFGIFITKKAEPEETEESQQ